MCVDFVIQRLWEATVIFDEYTYGPSTKDVKHLWRKQTKNKNRHKIGDTMFEGNMLLYNIWLLFF